MKNINYKPLMIAIITVILLISISFYVSADSVIDVGITVNKDNEGVTMDLIVNDLTYKVLELNISKNLAAQDLAILIKDSDFNVSIIKGTFTERVSSTKLVNVYETVCNDVQITNKDNDTKMFNQVCNEVITGTELQSVYSWQPITKTLTVTDTSYNIDYYPVLSKGVYRYTFATEIVSRAAGWGSSGTVYLNVNNKSYVDKQNSSWWNVSCDTRINFNTTSFYSDANQQIEINFSKNIDFSKVYLIDTSTNVSLPWVNLTGQSLMFNRSVTSGIVNNQTLYINCSAMTPQYNLTQVMLQAAEFDSVEEVAAFGAGTLNNTVIQRGPGAVFTAGVVRQDAVPLITENTSTVMWQFLKNSVAHYGITQFGTSNHAIGADDLTSAVNYAYYAGTAWTDSGVPLVFDEFVKIRYYINNSENAYIGNTRIYSVAKQADSTRWGWQDRAGDVYDSFYVYRDYGEYNPVSAVGEEQTQYNAPVITDLHCYNGTAWKTEFMFHEIIQKCRAVCTDIDGDLLYVNFSMYNSTTAQFVNATNNEKNDDVYTYDFSDVTVYSFGQWNVTAACYDGTYIAAETFNWSLTNTIPPIPPIITPVNNTIDSNRTVMVSAVVDAETSVSYEIQISNNSDFSIINYSNLGSQIFKFTDWIDGVYYLRARSYDGYNYSNYSSTAFYTLVTIAPIITILNPVNKSNVTGTIHNVLYSVNDGSDDTVSCTLYVDNVSLDTSDVEMNTEQAVYGVYTSLGYRNLSVTCEYGVTYSITVNSWFHAAAAPPLTTADVLNNAFGFTVWLIFAIAGVLFLLLGLKAQSRYIIIITLFYMIVIILVFPTSIASQFIELAWLHIMKLMFVAILIVVFGSLWIGAKAPNDAL
jgi:hypothetical protein